jgi:hypothetical protein
MEKGREKEVKRWWRQGSYIDREEKNIVEERVTMCVSWWECVWVGVGGWNEYSVQQKCLARAAVSEWPDDQ